MLKHGLTKKANDNVLEITRKLLPVTLKRIGIKSLEIEIYLLLMKNSNQTALNIAQMLKTNRPQVYRGLKTLQNKAVVNTSANRPAKFSAVSFDQVLDRFISTNNEKANCIERHENEQLTKWQTLMLAEG